MPGAQDLLTPALPLLAGALCLATAAAADEAGPSAGRSVPRVGVAISRLAVVREKDAPWLVQYAANELVDYLERMSGRRPPLRTVVSGPSLVMGTHQHSALVRSLVPEAPEVLQRSPDAFALRPVGDVLVIAGAEPLAVLYGAYHYLGRECGVGFFEDGERVPKRSRAPIAGVRADEAPVFALRPFSGMWDAWGDFRRNRSTYWTLEDYKRHYGWALKSRVNRFGPMSSQLFPIEQAFAYFSQFVPLAYGPSGGLPLAFDRASAARIREEFPEARFTEEEDPTYGGYYLLDLPTYTALLQRRLAEARRRFRGANVRCSLSLPVGIEGEIGFLRRYLKNPREHYVAATIAAARAFDPDAEIVADGWGIALTYPNWEEFRRHFVDNLSPEVRSQILILFNYPHFERFRRDFQYFPGMRWAYADIDFYGGQDYYFAPTPYSRMQNFAQDCARREGTQCIGWGIMSEATNVEPFYRQWLWTLAWDPFRFSSVDDFARDYVARRYSPAAREKMLASTRKMIEAFEHFHFRVDPYISSFCPVYRHLAYIGFPCVQAHRDRYGQWEDLRALEGAVTLALEAAPREAGNPLYRNYLVGVFHAYASELFKFPLVRMHDAYREATEEFRAGRADGEKARAAVALFERSAAEADAALAAIQSVWSARPDYRLRDMLADVGRHIPMTPQKEREIRGRCAAFQNGVYELMALLYRPQFAIVADDLRERLKRRETEIFAGEWPLFETNCINWRALDRRWNEPMISLWNDELLPRFEKMVASYFAADLGAIPGAFRGSDVEAVAAAMRDLRRRGMTAAAYGRGASP